MVHCCCSVKWIIGPFCKFYPFVIMRHFESRHILLISLEWTTMAKCRRQALFPFQAFIHWWSLIYSWWMDYRLLHGYRIASPFLIGRKLSTRCTMGCRHRRKMAQNDCWRCYRNGRRSVCNWQMATAVWTFISESDHCRLLKAPAIPLNVFTLCNECWCTRKMMNTRTIQLKLVPMRAQLLWCTWQTEHSLIGQSPLLLAPTFLNV